ncbi:integrase arm-type DNA-binding domain-containing protein [Sulfurovum sp. TSL6]|uniref:integrase arm-type DNA-binding domain-containing protein n=1 Tax=Sulfurovum sp. TSL6 TaxID=2826995 RepID=UPI001CC46F5D|nr:integrase arm-type DNA-binding domain-containing protein [Sulfurovum sp. TSL6]
MARRTLPLTDTEIKKAKPKEKGYKLFDGEGLFLWINTAGGKLWRLKYISPVSQKEKTYSIGKYPDITLAKARTERERLRQLIKSGIDPSQEKQENKKVRITKEINKADTFSKIAEDFLEHKTKISDDYKDMQRRRLERHISIFKKRSYKKYC